MAVTTFTWTPSPGAGRFVATKSLDPASVAANTTAPQNFTVTGLKAKKPVFIWFESTPTNTGVQIVNAACYTKDTLTVTFVNTTGGAIDLAAQNFIIWQP